MASQSKGNFMCFGFGIILSIIIIFATIAFFKSVHIQTTVVVAPIKNDGPNSTKSSSEDSGSVANSVIQQLTRANEMLQNEIIQLKKDIALKDSELAKSEEKCQVPVNNKNANRPRHCEDIQMAGERRSGIYTIYPFESRKNVSVKVYCDLLTEGGGWTVFQRRRPKITVPVDFHRTWEQYKEGFSGCSMADSHWLGLNVISELTSGGDSHLRIDMTDWDNLARYAEYSVFKVADETENFKLTVSDFYGDAGDSLTNHNGMYFTTKDMDNDISANSNCAVSDHGAWWYIACHQSNLNGIYAENGRNVSPFLHVSWERWHGYKYSLKTTEMKLRSRNFKGFGSCLEG